jgi:Bacterial Ig-like domain (group 3)
VEGAHTSSRMQSRGRKAAVLALFSLVLLTALAFASAGKAEIAAPPPPQVWSDKADYAPGELVTLSGANWAAGESVHIRVNDDAGQTWSRDVDVVADENGAFSDQFNLPNWFVAVYNVTATGASSGTATWSFTDAIQTSTTIASSLNPSNVGQSVTFTATVTCVSACTFTTQTVDFAEGANQNCNGGAIIGSSSTLTGSGPTTRQATFTTSSLSAGTHSIRACFRGGGPGTTPGASTSAALSQVVNADGTPPDTSITANPPANSNSSSASFSFTGTDNVTPAASLTFECKLDGGSFAACTSPQNYSGLAEGSHTFQVRAIDAAGNVDASPASFSWVVDTVAPDTSIDSNPSNPSNSSSASFGFSGSDPGGSGVASFECKLDGGSFAACTSPQNYSGLAEGSHTFQVRAIDAAGNVDASPASFTWLVDTVKPSSQASSPAFNNTATIAVSFTSNDPGANASGVAKVELWAKGPSDSGYSKVDETTTSLASGSFSYPVTQGDGVYRFYTLAVDAAGNRENAPAMPDTSVQVTTTLQDTIAPTSSASSPNYDNGGDIPVDYSASDGGSGLDEVELWVKAPGDSSFSLAMTDASPGATGSFSYSPSAGDGAYEFYTRARDNATNYESAPAAADDSTIVDTVAPTVNCGSADGVWHADNVSIGCTASDSGSGLADAGDASFSLSTSVAAGNETANASTNSRVVKDKAGNETTAGPISGNKIDRKGPSVTLTCPASPVLKDSAATASWSASDGGSGLAGPSNGTISLDTSSVGQHTASVPAGFKKDNVDNGSAAASCTYSVEFNWRGFFQPVDNLPALNKAKAGSAIPVKFSLSGNQGMNIFMAGYPSSGAVTCGNTSAADVIETTVTAGQSSLNYDAAADQYVYVWKTQTGWSGTCRTLTVKLVDGTVHQANFFFAK